ncbi:oligosaccharide flippase family protein [Clostridium sp. SHJSY1]|uniref:oligosaccharide flippase family protein n=1 Tax=Clostridium sp. SHJSY1 TaxID=2942483 RepID=UPI0028754159|nr:oligosaccharide flippase family protein [Clostridium sp. SHJSY1]MDS0526649.1 oligosaccharide flippase family protein [Clostridium sp. SHJSY1]
MNILKNYIYNTLYQILAIIIPLITMPYITRIFNPDQLGLNSYSLSIANYFILFGTLGMSMYGNRQIAYVRDDSQKLNKTFWSLFFMKLCTCIIAIILYYMLIFATINENKIIYIIQGISIFCVIFDISWLYAGLEDFKRVVLRNIIVKLISVILIFSVIKSQEDLVMYISITIIATILGTIVMWINMPKSLLKIDVDIILIKSHLKPLIGLFIPQISIQVYGLLSRTMIGWLSATEQVAYYDYSQRIIQIIITLINSVGTVLMPRVANIISNGNHREVRLLINKSFKYISYISIPMSCGLSIVGISFVQWFLGRNYYDVGILISLTSIIIIPVSWANIIGVQYLVAGKKENIYTISIIISAIFNFIINLITIGKLGAYGASISLIFAEWIGVIIQMVLVRKELDIKNMIKGVIKYIIATIPMSIIVYLIGCVLSATFITNVIQVSIGFCIYVLILFLLKDEVQKDVINKFINLLIKKVDKKISA